jgi:hypothetical protein
MRLSFIAVSVYIISASSSAQADKERIRQIYDEQLTNSEVFENLRILTKEIGPRIEGSSNLASAIEFTKALMLKYDFDTVYLQPAMVSNWKRGDQELVQIINKQTNSTQNINCLALGNSIGTGENGITGEVIEIYGMHDLEKTSSEKIEGKIVFLNEPFDSRIINTFEAYQAVNAQRDYGTSLASKKGAAGVIIRSISVSDDNFPHTGYMEYQNGIEKIPAVAISTNDANLLSDQLKKNPGIRANISLKCLMSEKVVSYNVIGELYGSEYQDTLIVVGGHIDSWDVGEGAHDDAGGCLQSIEVVRTFRTLNIKPRHTIRVILWTGEENSWGGKTEYAKQTMNNNEKHIAAIESDKGSFTPLGFSIDTKNQKAYEKMQSWKPLFEPYWVTVFQRGHAGVDIDPLKDDTNLLLGLITDSHKYFTLHHSIMDVFETVNKRELELCAATLTSIVYLIDKYGIE